MKDKIYIVKIGGNVIDDDANLASFLQLFSSLDGAKILVHGGGKLATQMAKQLDIPQQMVDGRRITDVATLKIVTMVYAGYINKNIVAKLQSLKVNAIGLSGADGGLLKAHKRNHATIDYGFVGDVDSVNEGLLLQLLKSNYCPVIAPITADAQGQLLNTNADTIAQEIAQAVGSAFEVHLIYCFEKAGVLLDVEDESSVIASITNNNFQQLLDEEVIFAGMLPKLQNAFDALNKGVAKVSIGKWDMLHSIATGSSGTTITNE
jgi:acetylglutamate kinase